VLANVRDGVQPRRVRVVGATSWIGTNPDLAALPAVHYDSLSHLVAGLLVRAELGACAVRLDPLTKLTATSSWAQDMTDRWVCNRTIYGYHSSMTLDDTNRTVILGTLEQLGWVIGGPRGAAAKLGLKRTTLIARMRRLGISRPITQEGIEIVGVAPESIC
jgi:hypothetical protein